MNEPSIYSSNLDLSTSVYFSKTAGTWRYEQDDDTEMEYDPSNAVWVPLVRH